VEGILDEVRRSYTSLKPRRKRLNRIEAEEEIFEVALEIQLLRLKASWRTRRNGKRGFPTRKEPDEITRAITGSMRLLRAKQTW